MISIHKLIMNCVFFARKCIFRKQFTVTVSVQLEKLELSNSFMKKKIEICFLALTKQGLLFQLACF